MTFGAKLFTSDVDVLRFIGIGIPVWHLVYLLKQTIEKTAHFNIELKPKQIFLLLNAVCCRNSTNQRLGICF